MLTILEYIAILVVVVLVLLAIVWFAFGRGEELPPIPAAHTMTRLPRFSITSDDVRDLRFQQVIRGYKTDEVDWALAVLGKEIDDLRELVDDLSQRDSEHVAVSQRATKPPGQDVPHGDQTQ